MPNALHIMPAQFGAVVGDNSRQLLTGDKLDATELVPAVDASGCMEIVKSVGSWRKYRI